VQSVLSTVPHEMPVSLRAEVEEEGGEGTNGLSTQGTCETTISLHHVGIPRVESPSVLLMVTRAREREGGREEGVSEWIRTREVLPFSPCHRS
jgi:hypothetical protein